MKLDSPHWLGISSPFLVDAGDGHRLHEAVLPAFLALQGAASEAGVDCQLASSYRSFERQLAIWDRKWLGQLPLYNAEGQQLNANELDDHERIEAILTWSALPGASRHHWGTDMDVYDRKAVDQCGHSLQLVDEEYQPDGPCYDLACWLNAHCQEFGFFRPFAHFNGGVARELWHLSHKPAASQFEALRSPSALYDTLASSNMLGKDAVLARFDELYPRYVLNQGHSS